MHRPGVELAISRSQVRPPHHQAFPGIRLQRAFCNISLRKYKIGQQFTTPRQVASSQNYAAVADSGNQPSQNFCLGSLTIHPFTCPHIPFPFLPSPFRSLPFRSPSLSFPTVFLPPNSARGLEALQALPARSGPRRSTANAF